MKLDKFIKRPVLSTVISILIVILGIIGLISLPIEQYPDIAPPTIMVRAYYPGANAQTVLNSVPFSISVSFNLDSESFKFFKGLSLASLPLGKNNLAMVVGSTIFPETFLIFSLTTQSP